MTQPGADQQRRIRLAARRACEAYSRHFIRPRVFKNVPWAKVMMWVFLLGDVFVFAVS